MVSDDAACSLVISQRLLGTREVILIHHTDCGMLTFTDDQVKADIEADIGLRPHFALEAFPDLERDIRQSIARIKHSPFIPLQGLGPRVHLRRAVGRLQEVTEAVTQGCRLGSGADGSPGPPEPPPPEPLECLSWSRWSSPRSPPSSAPGSGAVVPADSTPGAWALGVAPPWSRTASGPCTRSRTALKPAGERWQGGQEGTGQQQRDEEPTAPTARSPRGGRAGGGAAAAGSGRVAARSGPAVRTSRASLAAELGRDAGSLANAWWQAAMSGAGLPGRSR